MLVYFSKICKDFLYSSRAILGHKKRGFAPREILLATYRHQKK